MACMWSRPSSTRTSQRGVAAKIVQLLTTRQRRTLDRLTCNPVGIGLTSFFMLIVVWADSMISAAHGATPGGIVCGLVGLVALALTFAFPFYIVPAIIRPKNMVTIFLADSHANISFMQRNRDAVILAGISGVISFVFGILVAPFTVWLTNY
jgi:hypothetical protein